MKHDFEEHKARRIENAKNQAAKNHNQSEQQSKKARQMGSVMQGEPIKVGHHSENRHRKDLERMDNAMRSSIEHDKKAKYYESKVETIESNQAIFSDDPQALLKLREKLAGLVNLQETYKVINKCIRKNDRESYLALPSSSPERFELLKKEGGVPRYTLTNNNANIRAIRQRIVSLEKLETRPAQDEMIKGVRYLENREANRIQLIFPGKPSDAVRETLHRRYHFRWSGREGAWQRHLNNNGIWAAKAFLKDYIPE